MSANATITKQSRPIKAGQGPDTTDPGYQMGVKENPNMVRQAEYFIYVFNVGGKNHPITHPLVKGNIPACPPGERYKLAFKLPNIMTQVWADDATGLPRTHAEYGERVATDLINPANLGIDQWANLDESQIISSGQDMAKFGVFWSLSEVPSDEELVKITEKMKKHYRVLIGRADELARKGKLEDITQDMHMAADYFQYEASWHAQVEMPTNCPNCGEKIRKGIAYHKNSMDMVCVIDRKRYEAATGKTAE